MGRYYSGDIEGKFWFGVQSSCAAERFGGEMCEPSYVDFYFGEEHLDDVNEEIEKIEGSLGDMKQKIDDFFKANNGYNDDMLLEAGIDPKYLVDYADLRLGIKIRDCIVKQGSCQFTAEL